MGINSFTMKGSNDVPNVPGGVESLLPPLLIRKGLKFLMCRVELKVKEFGGKKVLYVSS